MAERNNSKGRFTKKAEPRKKRGWVFPVCMLAYGVIFLALTAWGLNILWDCMDHYERSRPDYAMDAYMRELTNDRIFAGDTALRPQLDERLESEDSRRTVILQKLESGVDYLLREKESGDGCRTYALICEGLRVGTVTLKQGAQTAFGFCPWQVAEESFSLPYPLVDPVSCTVPTGYTMLVNDVPLDESYITQENVHYKVYEDLYENYSLPTMVTYTAGPFLQEPRIQFLDSEGRQVAPEDFEKALDNCTQEQKQELTEFSQKFVKAYVAYTGSTNKNRNANIARLLPYILEGSEFRERIFAALGGLEFGQTYRNTIKEITMNLCTRMEDGSFCVDLTYLVETVGKKGPVDVLSNARVIITRSGNDLKVVELYRY